MFPELVHVGPFPVRVFGLAMACSFLVGVLYVRHMVRRNQRDFSPFLTTAYLLILAGVVGARLSYVALHLDEFSGRWLDAVVPWQTSGIGLAGLNLYGGVLLALATVLIYLVHSRQRPLDVLDFFAPAFGLALGLARIGCFCNGCCFGTPTNLPWGVHFPVGSIPWYTFGDTALHPAQLYSALYGLVLFVILHRLLAHRAFAGQVVAVLLVLEAVFRFAIESVRHYEPAMVFYVRGYAFTYNQLVSVGLFLGGTAILLRHRMQLRRGKQAI